MELLSKKELECKDLENSQPIHNAKHEKVFLEENIKSVTKQPFVKEIGTDVNHRLTQPPQWENWQFELKRRWEGMKAGCWMIWILQDKTIELFFCEHTLFFWAGKE